MRIKIKERQSWKSRNGNLPCNSIQGLALVIWVLVGGSGSLGEAAVVITPTQEVVMSGSGLNQVISDGGAITVGETLAGYTHLPENFYEISVSFRILGDTTQTDPNKRFMLSGDYRVFLRHGSGLMTPDTVGSYLLENVGQEYVFPQLGYWDSGGMDITLEDSAAHSIQGYRSEVTGDHMTEVTGVLDGIWRPKQAMAPLGQGDPNGVWDLVFEDAILGGQGNLQSWSITLKAVPEPSSASLLIAGTVGLLALSRRRKRTDWD